MLHHYLSPTVSVRHAAYMMIVHDPDYRTSFEDFSTFTGEVSQKIVEADETIPELPVKDVVSI